MCLKINWSVTVRSRDIGLVWELLAPGYGLLFWLYWNLLYSDPIEMRVWTEKKSKKVDAKCWLAEMTLVMTSLLLARVFNHCLHSRPFSLCADWRESDSSVNGQPGNWRRNSNSRDVVASSPSFSQPAARAGLSHSNLITFTLQAVWPATSYLTYLGSPTSM